MKKRPDPNKRNPSAPKQRKFSSKSTATRAQYERIDEMLSTGKKSTIQLRRGGVMMPAARIKEMNERHGYVIHTVDRRDIYDEQGYLHPRVAIYELVERPAQATNPEA
jgi:hypothetical protein